MTKEEFEQLITKNEHQNEILRLVEESISILPSKDENSVNARYDECAQLYKDSLEDYTHFRLNISKQMDLLRYHSYIIKHQDNILAANGKLIEEVTIKVDAYVQNSEFNDPLIVSDIATLLETYEKTRLFLENKISELEDKKHLKELSDVLKQGYSLYSLKLRGKSDDKTLFVKSEKMKNMFVESFLSYFENRFLENEKDLEKQIYKLKSISNSQMTHKLAYDLYIVFMRHGKLPKCSKNSNLYDLTDGQNNFYSLNIDVSNWIFGLLIELNFIPKKFNKKSKEERKRYIKDCIRDKKCRALKLEDYCFDLFSPFA